MITITLTENEAYRLRAILLNTKNSEVVNKVIRQISNDNLTDAEKVKMEGKY